jgi:hypothetical protein
MEPKLTSEMTALGVPMGGIRLANISLMLCRDHLLHIEFSPIRGVAAAGKAGMRTRDDSQHVMTHRGHK